MTNYKEILRLHSLGINNTRIAESCGRARSTVIAALQRAAEQELSWNKIKNCSTEEVARKLYPSTALGQHYKMPDYEWVHREMQKSGVTLSLLWVEYCEQCRQSGELPYKSTQFNKYYADYVHKTKATMHLEHKPARPCRWTGRPDGSSGGHRHRGAAGCIPVCSGAAIQRLRIHRGLSGHEAGGLDHRSCQRLPVFRRRHPHPHAGQPQDRYCQELPYRDCAQQILPRNGGALRHRHSSGPSPQSQGQGPLWRVPLARSLPGSWRPCVTANFCPLWN